LFLFSASDAVHKCEVEEKQRGRERGPHLRGEWRERVYRRVVINARCAGSADDVWVALSGLAVAAFTFTLWRSTEKLWTTTNASLNADRPYLFISGLGRVFSVETGGDCSPALKYRVINHGKTPAIIKIVRQVVSDDPFPPTARVVVPIHPLIVSSVVGPGERVEDMQLSLFGLDEYMVPMSDDQAPLGSTPDWFYLRGDHKPVHARLVIEYDGPFTKGHVTSAMWRYEDAALGFVRFGGEAYNTNRPNG
jgi:hypothetical protein